MLFSEINDYAIYLDDKGKIKVVRRGFTTLGFLFTWIWAFFKHLYGISITIFTVVFLLGFIIDSREFLIAIQIAIMIAVGTQGNEWIEYELNRKGYKFVKLVSGKSQKEALIKYADNVQCYHEGETGKYCTLCGEKL